MSVRGSCHCGKIGFEADGAPQGVIECNCSHCARKGLILWFVTPDKFRATGEESAMTTYQFNTHAIEHKFCPSCGVQPFARGTGPDGKAMVAVNLRCADDFDRAAHQITQVDGKNF
ncbi:MAG: GFA family protein [Hyphomonadaceae bacterium]